MYYLPAANSSLHFRIYNLIETVPSNVTLTSNAYLSPHRYPLLRHSLEARGDGVRFQHFVDFLNICFFFF
jgi:hypothetical protein